MIFRVMLRVPMWIGILAAVLFTSTGRLRAETPVVTLESLLHEMVDPAAVARWPQPEYSCRQASSYDRLSKTPSDPATWFANTDNMDGLGKDLRWETIRGRRECVMLDVDGPGAIVRFWSGGNPPKGNVRFYLDGAEEPAIEGPLYDLFSGKGFVPKPLAIENAGAAINLFLPIPFAKHCKITYDEANPKDPNAPPPGRWFNIEYRVYVPGTAVQSFRMEAFKSLQPLVQQVARDLLNPPVFKGGKGVTLATKIEAGQKMTVDLAPGPKAIRKLDINLKGVAPDRMEQILRSLVISAKFDGEQTIWCPLGEFSGSGVGLNPLESWYRTVTTDGKLTCRWVMPYQETGQLMLENLGKEEVEIEVSVALSDWKWDDRSMHFHANWRYESPIPTRPMKDWNYIAIDGKGLYLGDTLAILNPVANWWGEGDEKVWVDGEKFPSHFGTGSEDYYGYAWGNPTVFQGPFCNQPRAGARNRGYTTNTRTRSLDAIPFERSLKFDIEIWHWSDCKVTYSVATYWYARPGATSNRRLIPQDATAPVEQIPPVSSIQGAIECENMKVLARSEGLQIQRQDGYLFESGNWSGDSQILVMGKKPGDFLELLVAENVTGPKKVVLHGTKSYDYGILRFFVNGKQSAKDLDAYDAKPILTGPIDLGTFDPKDGKIVLRVEVVGGNASAKASKSYFGFDAVTLAP